VLAQWALFIVPCELETKYQAMTEQQWGFGGHEYMTTLPEVCSDSGV
jgi:hypothetical protein